VNGTLYDRDSLPPDLAIRFGTSLGLSPVCYLRENLLLVEHLDVLGRSADALGYSTLDTNAARDAITTIDTPGSVVALIPTPVDHKAAAPGADWMLVTRPFVAPDASVPLRLCVSRHRRNHRSPTINALLLGDGELLAGTREATSIGYDEVVWLNLDDAVSCIGAGALVADLGGRIVTPRLTDGVPESAWRAVVVDVGDVVDARVELDDLRSASAVACVWPWGSVQAVEMIDDTAYADGSLAPRIAATIAAVAGRA
jgi:branched-subunit amino acid aminotransferase/4-amino-4-deoxychorismate lyase